MESGVGALSNPTERDGTRLALLEVAAALVLAASFWVPWLNLSVGGFEVAWAPDPGGSLTMGDLLSPFMTLVAILATLVVLIMPSRGARVTALLAFLLATWAAELELHDYFFGDKSGWVVQPPLGIALPIYAAAAVLGSIVAAVNVLPAESSTAVWRALGRPNSRTVGPWIAYVVALLITLPIALFPMDPHWWIYVWLLAFAAGPLMLLRRHVRA